MKESQPCSLELQRKRVWSYVAGHLVEESYCHKTRAGCHLNSMHVKHNAMIVRGDNAFICVIR